MILKKLFQKAGATVTICVIVFLFSPHLTLASQTKINPQEFQRIKTGLDIAKTTLNFGNILLDDGGLMNALNTVVKGGSTVTDVTYGLLVLSAINEMELMDLVLSQDYKTIEREYFEQILDERTNLISYWKGVGFDLPRVLSGRITGPMAGLTLNSFAMTNKVIQIFTEFEVLKRGKQYDGLWRYFDERMHGESHQGAWELAEPQMGFATKSSFIFRGSRQVKEDENYELEQQFSSLWDKWAPYATPFGISETYKQQAKEEMKSMLAVAAEAQRLAEMEKQREPSWLKQKIYALKEIALELTDKVYSVASDIVELNPFSAGPIVSELKGVGNPSVKDKPAEEKTEEKENEAKREKPQAEPEPESVEARLQPTTSSEEIIEEIIGVKEDAEEKAEGIKDANGKKDKKDEQEKEQIKITKEKSPPSEPQLCQKTAGELPKRYRALINEVAWMGSSDSPNDEWIELRNIWGVPVNLSGWQLQDKNQQIKIIFEQGDTIAAGGYFLLERTDDNSMPQAKADKIYTGGLNNSNEALYLFDNNCQLEDEVVADPNWPDGDNTTKKSMERLDHLYWYTSASRGGSAGKDNSTPPTILIHPSAPAQATPTPAPTYLKVLINEVQIDSGGNTKNDSVKLYNPNDTTVDLTNWYVQRKTASSSEFSTYAPKTLFAGKSIEANGYFLIAHASSTLATSADAITTYPLTKNNTVVLKNPNGEITDTVITEEEANAENESSASQIVVINEIAWAGTKTNSADEWIELYNNATSTIDLTGWSVVKDSEEWIIFSTSSIAAHSYFLLERTDDQTISDTAADLFFTGALNNSGHKLELKNSLDELVDIIDASAGWPAGKSSPSYASMERISPTSNNWANNNRITINGLDAANNNINGTPKSENSVAKAATEVIGDRTFTDDFTLMKLGSPYTWEGSLIIEQGAKLTVEPGVTVKFKHTAFNQPHAQIKIKGAMEAIGTNEQKITFTSFQENNYWDGIYFENSTSTFENVVVGYAGKWHYSGTNEFPPYTYGAVYAEGGKITIKNSMIENSQTFGVWLKNSSGSLINNTTFRTNPGIAAEKPAALYVESGEPTIQNSTFENNDIAILAGNYSTPTIADNNFSGNQTPIKINSLLANISGNTAQNNNTNGILLGSFGFNESINQITWQKNDLPYVIENNLTVPAGKILDIDSGVIVKFKNNGAISVDGSLNAQGKPNEKIIFTSINDDEYGGDTNNDGNNFAPAAGQWKFINFSAASANSDLNYMIVRYGGFLGTRGGVSDRDGVITIQNNTLSLNDSIIENNRVGMEMINSDFDNKSKNISVKNNAIGIYIEGACPNLGDITFEQNTEYNVFPTDCQ